MNLKKFFMILLCLAVVLPLMVAQPKDMESISIVAEVPVSEKGYSLDPASPYLPPVSGLANNMAANGAVYSVYVPSNLYPWAPGVIIIVPDGETAEGFAMSELGREWMAAADELGFALGFAESENGTWNVSGDPSMRNDVQAIEDVYTQMRSKSVSLYLPFTMDKSRVTLVGYEEGGEMALAAAAACPAAFCGVVAVNAEDPDEAYIEELGKGFCYPFPADGMRGLEEVGLVANTLQMPVWFIGCKDEAVKDYFRTIDGVDSYAYDDYAIVEYDSDNVVSAVWSSASDAELTPAVIWNEFAGTHTRPLGKAGGHLAFAMNFAERPDGTGYIFTEEEYDGLIRRYMTYVPESYDPSVPAPMVLVLHGYTATMYALAEESRWANIAEREGLIVVFAQGYPNPDANPANIPAPSWMVPALFGDAEGADDVSFILHVIDETKANYNIDSSRVYGTGHSNGCAMTLALASVAPDVFAAIAPIGYAAEGLTDSIDTIIPLSLYYGQYDSAVNADGVANATAYWTALNGIGTENSVTETSDDGLFTTTTYPGPDGVPLVQFTQVKDSAHSYFPEESWRIWNEFFSHYARVDGKIFYDGAVVE